MSFSKEFKEKFDTLIKLSAISKEEILESGNGNLENKNKELIKFIKSLNQKNFDEIKYLKEYFQDYSNFLTIHFKNFMKVFYHIVKYLEKYPTAPKGVEVGFSSVFRYLIKDKNLNLFNLWSLYSKNDDDHFCVKFKRLSIKEINSLEDYEKKKMYRKVLEFYFRKIRNEQIRQEFWNLGNEVKKLKKSKESQQNTINRQAEELTNAKIQTGEYKPKPFPNLKSWRDLTLTLNYNYDERLEYNEKWKIIASFEGKEKEYTIEEFYGGKRKKLIDALVRLSTKEDGKLISTKNYARQLKIKLSSIRSTIYELNKILKEKFGIEKRPLSTKDKYIYCDLKKIKYNSGYFDYESSYDKQGFKKHSYRDDYQENINHYGEDNDTESF